VVALDKILADKVEKINFLRLRLNKFNVLLKDEEALALKFSPNNDNEAFEIYDLDN